VIPYVIPQDVTLRITQYQMPTNALPHKGRGDATTAISPKVCEYVETLPLGSHAILCYDTKSEAAQVLSSYLKGGLDRNEAVCLIAPTQDAYSDMLQRAGIEAKPLEGNGRLRFLSMNELYAHKSKSLLDFDRVFRSAQQVTREGSVYGFKGTRFILLSECQLEYISPANLLRFESELGRTFNLPLTVICTYDGHELIKRGLGELLLSLFQHHGRIIGKELAIENLEQAREV